MESTFDSSDRGLEEEDRMVESRQIPLTVLKIHIVLR